MTSFNDHELHQLPAPRPSLLRANMWYLLAAAGLMLLSFALALFVEFAPFEINAETLSSTISTAYEIGILALPVILYAVLNRGAKKTVRLNKPDVRMLLFAVVLAVVGMFMANYLTMWWLLLIEKLGGTLQESGVAIPTDTASMMLSILLVGIVPGVCEEMLFRGGLMGAWERFGKKTALIVTSVLFALLHGTIAGLPNQIMMGLVLGYIVLISHSVFVGMIYHAVHNSMTMFMAYTANSAADPTAAAEITENLSASLGGTEGYAALLLITAVTVIVFVLILMAMTESAKKHGKNVTLTASPETISPAPRFAHFLPLIAALCVIAFNYAADFAATFG